LLQWEIQRGAWQRVDFDGELRAFMSHSQSIAPDFPGQSLVPGHDSLLSMQRILIILGALIALIGLAWPWLSKLPLGRLPGDIVVDRPGFRFFLPVTTMIIASLVLSLIVWLLRR
jgi:Protein of unknown function (DUF2905)